MMYSCISIDLNVLCCIALANKALLAYDCYYYNLLDCLSAIDYDSNEVENIVELDEYYRHEHHEEEKTISSTNCPVGYYSCNGCGKCEY